MVGRARCRSRSSTSGQNPVTVGDWEPATKNSVLSSDRLSAMASNTTARPATGTGMFNAMIDRVWVNRSAKRY